MNYQLLPIEYLQRGKYQPRQTFDNESLRDLAQSIQSQGLIEPLVVRQIEDQRYEIIAGERRWRASMLAGLTEVPCLIGNYTDEQTAAVSLIENIQREDLNLLEEAKGYQRLHTEFHFNQDDIGVLVGKSRSHIANMLRLLSLCEPVQELLRSRQLSLGHARALVGLSPTQQQTYAQNIHKEGWSVRRLEEEVRLSKLPSKNDTPNSANKDVMRLQSQLSEYMGTPVKIDSDHDAGGWLKIKFFDNDTLAGLLERIGLEVD